ncbi:beta-xylosidase [Streptomyces sp. TRM66268-LWL]|uniref:Beta-xylosidase n=1 Tax=Streptomyces polyasparticus TaxID=2767826 RepID=A0ABR7SLA3_9ACTN|nr:beta-xylosidase [Streptomyces polyasparticus]MBC9716208.1 beta-xylosidase [Streptomyces polyasparticus]
MPSGKGSYRGRRRRWTAGLGVLALGVMAGGAALATPAAAVPQEVEFTTVCTPPSNLGIPPIEGPTKAKITVTPASPKVGDTVTVTYEVTKPASGNPTSVALPADIMKPKGKVILGGAQTGEVAVEGPRKNTPVAGNAPFPAFSMTGTFTVTAPGDITFSPGDYTINTNYIIDIDIPCVVKTPPAPVSETVTATGGGDPTNPRKLTLSAASGAPDAYVTGTLSGFTPSTPVTLAGWNGTAITADKLTATSTAAGGQTMRIRVKDPATVGIVAFEGAAWDPAKGAGPQPYTLTTPGGGGTTLDQNLKSSVKAGQLTMTQAGNAVMMSGVDFGKGGPSTGALQQVTVKDFRGGPAGWSLTGKVTKFTGPNGAYIDADKLSWTPKCATKAGSPSQCAAGTAGPVGASGATLAQTPNAALTGGEFTVDAGLSLNVPEFTAPGEYAGVLTLTLT